MRFGISLSLLLPACLAESTRYVSSRDPLDITFAPAGGYAATVSPVE